MMILIYFQQQLNEQLTLHQKIRETLHIYLYIYLFFLFQLFLQLQVLYFNIASNSNLL